MNLVRWYQRTLLQTTALGDRIKGYEAPYRSVLPRRTYTLLRVDGRAFHSYLRGAEKGPVRTSPARIAPGRTSATSGPESASEAHSPADPPALPERTRNARPRD